MDNFTVTFNKDGVTGLLFFIIYIICIANASGDTEIHNEIRDYPANSGQHTLYCNGTWCIMNEQYCDKSANKCMACVYNKSNCTQHLDCLQYCIDKGVEQAIHENEGTATEENSTPAWALPLFVVFLILFLVSCVGNLVVFLWWFHQRKQDPPSVVKPEEKISLTEDKELSDTTEENDSTEENDTTDQNDTKKNDTTEQINTTEQNGTETKEETRPPIQETSKSNE